MSTPAVDSAAQPMNVDPTPSEPNKAHAASTNGSSQSARRPSHLHSVKTKSLNQFANSHQLVSVMRDAIVAHQRLHKDAGTLHGDINTNTIIILKHPNGKIEGALVDFDLPISVAARRKMYKPDPPVPPQRPNDFWRWR